MVFHDIFDHKKIDIGNPWKCRRVDDKLEKKLLQQFRGEKNGFVQVGPKSYLFPMRFAKDGPSLYDFKPRASDTWIVTYPRSGTTLTQELVWLLSNEFDYKTAAEVPLHERFPFLEFSACVNKQLLEDLKRGKDKKTQELIEKETRDFKRELDASLDRRFIKTHLPFSLLNPGLLTCGAKVIYVARNPKDVAVSYYHLHRLFKTLDYNGSFKEFWDYFENDQLMWSPYWSHLKEAWNVRHNANLLFIFYDELQKNMEKSIGHIANFLQVNVNEDEISKLTEHLSIENFRANRAVNFEALRSLGILNDTQNGFVRSGKSGGDISGYFTPEISRRADKWIMNNLKNTSMRFPKLRHD